MRNKFEKDFYKSRDSWWSIKDLYNDSPLAPELRGIMDLSLYNQRDMLLEIDKLKAEINKQNEIETENVLKEPKKREILFRENPLLEKIDYFLYSLKK